MTNGTQAVSKRLIHAVASTLGARLVSAMLSFLVFAKVASALAPTSAARVLFFSFAFGFALATFRTFHLIGGGITGVESRSQRCRRVRAVSRTLMLLSLLLSPATAALLLTQGIGWPIAMAGVLLTVVCAHDLDLVRAVVGRPPLLPWLTAMGGAMGLALLLCTGEPTEAMCGLAFLLQWLPVAVYQLRFGKRLLRLALPGALGAGSRSRAISTPGTFLVSIFDGAVLNAPFILALPMVPAAAVDLALGNRLFIASLALFSLVASWVVSGDVRRLALGLGVHQATVFAVLQFLPAMAIGGLYAGIYGWVAKQDVSTRALVIFVVTLGAYMLHATAIRFAATGTAAATKTAAYSVALAGFFALMLLQRLSGAPQLGVVVGAVVVALSAPALLMFWSSNRSERR